MRVRFAPSPTGYLHIGNARTAVINSLIAKKENAEMVLRIEDTDMERSSIESEKSIIADLKWLGIEWQEGPDTGGALGPYRQSERFDIYREYTEKLLAGGKAYYCYCTREEIDAAKKGTDSDAASFEYNGRCRDLSDTEKSAFEAEGRKPTIRFRVPENKTITVKDHIKGDIDFNSGNIGGDFIITRSDGTPVYNYIVIIDDALMKISHVIRGEDHLSNTPKQVLIAEALDLPVPEYAHLALVLGPDRSKLSKRHGMTSVEMYRDEGYLPESLVNYLSMLGWATESGEEILSTEDIVKQMDLKSLAKSAAVFDFQKLRWMNGNYIRNYDLAEITEKFLPYIHEAGFDTDAIGNEKLMEMIDLLRGNCEVLSEIASLIAIFLNDVPEPDDAAVELLGEDDSRMVINAAREFLLEDRNDDFFNDLVQHVKETTSLKGKKLFMPIRALLTCRLKGPDMAKAVPLLGIEKCRMRINFWYDKK